LKFVDFGCEAEHLPIGDSTWPAYNSGFTLQPGEAIE
jgi:hypothetical protein